MSNLTQFGSGAIKSIQRGVTHMNPDVYDLNVTITTVNMAKTEVRFLGQYSFGYYTNYTFTTMLDALVYLQDANTIHLQRVYNGSGAQRLSWELTEYY